MSRSIPALVQPAMLIWARQRAGYPRLEDAALKLGIDVERLQQWESGSDRPTIAQLRKLGEVYRRPLAVFFLSEPPRGFDPQREFRRLPGITPQTESPALRLALRTALFRREAARDLYESLGEPVPECRVVAHPGEEEEVVGQRIRAALGVSWETQLSWTGPYAALNAWRAAIEQQGVLVFQTGEVELSEMRGTSVPQGPLPVILLNSTDAPHGRVFTLLHEFAHILLTSGGHHTSRMEGQRLPEDQALERVSNRFAAAALMPRRDFLEAAASQPAAVAGDEDGLRRFANLIKVSPEAILRRLMALRRVSPALYRQKRRAWQQRSWFALPEGSGGPPVEVRVVSSVGRPFASLVLEGYQRNAVSSADVVDYLGVQLKHLNKIAEHLLLKPAFAAFA